MKNQKPKTKNQKPKTKNRFWKFWVLVQKPVFASKGVDDQCQIPQDPQNADILRLLKQARRTADFESLSNKIIKAVGNENEKIYMKMRILAQVIATHVKEADKVPGDIMLVLSSPLDQLSHMQLFFY